MSNELQQQVLEIPYAVWGVVIAIVLMTPFVTFQTDFVQLPITLLVMATGLLLWALRSYYQPLWFWRVMLGSGAVTAMTLLVSRQWYVSMVALLWMWAVAMLFLLCTSWFRLSGWRKGLLLLLAASQLLLAVPGMWTFLRSWQRATGFLYNANGLGGALLWGVFGGLIYIFAGKFKRIIIPLWVLVLVAWAMTISLTAYLAAIVPGIVALWWFRKSLPWKKIVPIVLVTIGCVAAVWFIWKPQKLVTLMTSQHAMSSITQRVEFDRTAIAMWRKKPLTGWGIGTYRKTFPRFTNQFLEQPLYAHNVYLQVLAETGIVGAVGWLTIVVLIGRYGWLAARRSEGDEKVFLQALWIGWLAFSIHAAIDFSWHFPAGLVWWIIASALFVVRQQQAAPVPRRWPSVLVTASIAVCFFGIAAAQLLAIQASDRGLTAQQKVDDNTAITELTTAIRYTGNPSDVASAAETYWVRRQKNDLVDGEKLLRKSLRHNQDDYVLHDGLGLNLVAQKKSSEAISAFATATMLDPLFHPSLAYNYIMALKNNGQKEKAIIVLREALKRYGNGNIPNPIILRQLPLLEQLKAELLPNG